MTTLLNNSPGTHTIESDSIANAFRMLILDHPVPMWVFDRTTLQFLDVNRAAEEKYGYNRREFLAMTLKDIRPVEDVHRLVENVAQSAAQTHSTTEWRHRLRNGSLIDVEISAHGIEYAGRQAAFVIAYDITERNAAAAAKRRSEEDYRNLFDNASDAIVIFEPENEIILQANKKACELYGFGIDELVGMSLKRLTKDVKRGERQIFELLRTGEYVSFETVHLNKAGEEISILLNSSVIDYQGRQAVLSINRDFTDRKKVEQSLRDIQRRESIGMLSSGIAHDFNNLLGAMMGNITIAQSRIAATHPATQNMDKALLAMERAAELTNQILAYAGKGRYEMRRIDVVQLVREHMSLYELSLPKAVKLLSHLSAVPVCIQGDPGQIKQVLMNLIINAGDAIEEGPGVVSIAVAVRAMNREELAAYSAITNSVLKDGTYALIQVTDTGIGMTREAQKIIFDPFYTTKFIGRGLGLSAVLGIIRGHDGGIAIDSTVGVGTTFRVILPVDAAAEPSFFPQEQSSSVLNVR